MTMRKLLPVLFIGLTLLFSPVAAQTVADNSPQGASDNGPSTAQQPASAGPSQMFYLGFGSAYPYQDFGFYASKSPVVYGGTTFTWNSGDNLDFWASKGAGGAANELDVCYWHDGSFSGTDDGWGYQAKGCFYFLSGGKPIFSTFADDAGYAHFDFGRTLKVSTSVSIGLHSKTELIDGLNDVPFFVVERIGVPIVWQATDKLSLGLEPAHAWNLTGNAKSPWELTPSVTWNFGSVSLTGKDKMAYVDHKTYHEALIELDVSKEALVSLFK